VLNHRHCGKHRVDDAIEEPEISVSRIAEVSKSLYSHMLEFLIYSANYSTTLHTFNNYSTTLHTFTLYRTTLHVVRAIPTTPVTDKELYFGSSCNIQLYPVEIRARASKQDSELGRLVNLGSLQCNPICINRELHTDQTIQASSSSTGILTEYVALF
jgi:hypothetical protein